MKTIQETLETPVIDEYDVIVVGEACRCRCCTGAARQDAKTLFIEQYAFLGGMWTAGMVIPIWDWENQRQYYAKLFKSKIGNMTKWLRHALGAYIIQAENGFYNEEMTL